MTHPIIATPHGVEAVEAVVQYGVSHDDARALHEFMPIQFAPVGPLVNFGDPFPPGTTVRLVDALGDAWHGRDGGVRRDGSGQEWDTPWDRLPERRFPMRVGTNVFPYIYTPFGLAPKPKPGQWLVRHLDNTVTVHDTDPRIEPTWGEWSWGWADKDEPAIIARVHKTRDAALGEMGGRIAPVKLLAKPRYPVTLAGKPYTLVGEWVEVAE